MNDGIIRVLNWANSPSPYVGPLGRGDDLVVPTEKGMTNIQVLGKLIAMNGFKAQVNAYGTFSGPLGLSQPEAHLLMEMAPYLQGMVDGAGLGPESTGNLLEPELRLYADKWEAANAAKIAAEAAAPPAAEPAAEAAEAAE